MNTFTMVDEDVEGFRGRACLVRCEETGDFFVVSTITDHGAYGETQTMAFKADEDGNILDWLEVAGGGNMSREDVLEYMTHCELDDISSFDRYMFADDEWEDFLREDGSLSAYDDFDNDYIEN